MWEQVVLTGAMAAAAGAMALPAARLRILGDVEQDWLAHELEFDRIEPDGQTVRLKTGAFFRVFHLRGISYDAKVQNEQDQMLKGRAALLNILGEQGVTPRFFAVKRERDISYDATWPSPALTEIGEAERQVFRSGYRIEWFLVLSTRSMRHLLDGCAKVFAMAAGYRPALLSRPDDPADPCRLTGFINFLVCGDLRDDLPTISENISGNLPAADPVFDKSSGHIVTIPRSRKVHRIIAVRGWPEVVSGKLFAEILALKGDIEISQICEPWDRDHAQLLFKRKVIEQSSGLFGNPSLAAESEAIVQLLVEGETTIFNTQLQIVGRGDDEAALDVIVSAITEILGRRRVIYSVETSGAAICWFNRLPTSDRRRVTGASKLLRPLILRDQNVAALWAFHHSPPGMMKGPYGDLPVRFLRSPSGQAYAFQFHVSAKPQSIGNYMVFAPSGGGKSTLMMHLLGGLAKFDGVRSYIFDSKEGARFMIEAMGGIYQGYDNLGLNPLDVGEDTPANRARIYAVLRAMAGPAGGEESAAAAFAHALDMAFTVAPPERTLNTIYEFAFPRRSQLRRAFARWVADGKGAVGMNAHIFNAPHDGLGGFLEGAHMVGINMNEALDDPVVGPPVVAHIAAAISKSAAAASKGFCIFIDEAAKLLQNDGFRDLAMEMYREYRKLNGCVGLAFQDPAALFRSGVAEAYLENTATLLFLPNSQASQASLEPFNFNDEQKDFILGGRERRPGAREVLIVKRDAASGLDETAIVDVDLTPLGDSLRFYRAGVDANRDLAELKKRWGDEWQSHL